MNTFGNTKNKNNPSKILGSMGFFDEESFEKESAIVSSITSGAATVVSEVATGIFEAALSIGETVSGAETKADKQESDKFPKTGSIEFQKQAKQIEQLQKEQKDQKEANAKKAFFQALKEDRERTQRAKDKLLFEEEINDIITNLPTEQKNQLLHYQASYKDRSVYQRAELRRKIIEQRKKADKQEKAASIPSPAKEPSAMEGAFEGRSGTQGSGTANLSNQAVG